MAGRELKVMLRGDGAARDLAAELEGLGLARSAGPKPKEPRVIAFFDTPDRAIRGSQQVLRARVRHARGRTELTLKHRTADGSTPGGTGFAPGVKGKAKVEEDIKPGPTSLLSRSWTVKLTGAPHPPLPPLYTLADAAAFFAGLPAEGPLRAVRAPVHERVDSLGTWGRGDTEVEAAVVSWHEHPSRPALLREFSFRHGDSPHGDALLAAYERLLTRPWADTTGGTKTAWVYGDWAPGS